MSTKICVMGSGAWGSAISSVLTENGNEVSIYGICQDEVDDINLNRKNSKYFGPTLLLHEGITAFTELAPAITGARIIVLAIPSFAIEESVEKILPYINKNTVIVNLAKGFDKNTEKLLGQLTRDLLPKDCSDNVVSLLGPTFASEVAEKQITAITASSYNYEASRLVQDTFTNSYFKVCINNDPIGTEYCAALKNIIALACGIVDGLGYKINTRSALITRGISEIARYVTHFGGNESTCYGLAGIGDLILTCSSTTSRNYSAGYEIGRTSYKNFISNNSKTVEGVYACEIAYQIAKENNIQSPIVECIYNIAYNRNSIIDEIEKLKELIFIDEH